MNIIYTVLVAFALGYFLNQQRAAAAALYVAGGAFVFTFQSVNLLLEWVGGSESAFGGPYPSYEGSQVVGYGVVNLVITLVGVGLVLLGATVAARRSDRSASPVGAQPRLTGADHDDSR